MKVRRMTGVCLGVWLAHLDVLACMNGARRGFCAGQGFESVRPRPLVVDSQVSVVYQKPWHVIGRGSGVQGWSTVLYERWHALWGISGGAKNLKTCLSMPCVGRACG